MKRHAVLSALLIMFCTSLVAQTTEPAVMSEESISEKIEKCRNLTYNKTMYEHDTTVVRELVNYAQHTLETSGNVAFFVDEYRLLYILNGFYADFISSIRTVDDSVYFENVAYKLRPQNSDYYYNGISYLNVNSAKILEDVRKSTSIDDSEKRFIELYIKHLITKDDIEVNAYSDEFLSVNTDKTFENYTRRYIRHVYRPYSDFGIFGALLFGSKVTTESLTDIDNVGFNFGINIALMYKRIALMFDLQDGFGRLRSDISKGGITLEKRTRYVNRTIGVSLGYKLPVRNKWFVIPAVGLHKTWIIDNRPDMEKTDFKARSNANIGAGIEIGREFGSFENNFRTDRMRYIYGHIGLKYTILPTKIGMQSGDYKGLMHCINLAVGFGINQAHRVY
ncbi:MAG: hypothetical protein J6Y82_02255 [Bacteroidales bacterium]|nr:hypothetical protein [Bacteroidales bacterium]